MLIKIISSIIAAVIVAVAFLLLSAYGVFVFRLMENHPIWGVFFLMGAPLSVFVGVHSYFSNKDK